uniref:Uncharacterized protein n=1 Tax=Anguilla anguilla TaxID=7936 RepID=A0A0E9RBH0_ANGAN
MEYCTPGTTVQYKNRNKYMN